ncbi:hypothetical protein ACU4GD_44505 [Cupriavidus basilensis]
MTSERALPAGFESRCLRISGGILPGLRHLLFSFAVCVRTGSLEPRPATCPRAGLPQALARRAPAQNPLAARDGTGQPEFPGKEHDQREHGQRADRQPIVDPHDGKPEQPAEFSCLQGRLRHVSTGAFWMPVARREVVKNGKEIENRQSAETCTQFDLDPGKAGTRVP